MECTLCQCDEAGEIEGFPMCEHHMEYDEEGPPCRICSPEHEDISKKRIIESRDIEDFLEWDR